MAPKQVSDEVRRALRQLREVEDRLLDGVLAPEETRQGLQDVMTRAYVPGGTPAWFDSHEVQFGRVLRWCRMYPSSIGRISLEEQERASAFPQAWPRDQRTVHVLVPWLGNFGDTFDHLRQMINIQLGSVLKVKGIPMQGLWIDKQHIRAHPDHQPYPDYPCLRWVELDLAAWWGVNGTRYVADAVAPPRAGIEIMAAAAHFPRWLEAMDGQHVPWVWLPGVQIRRPGVWDNWEGVPGILPDEETGELRLKGYHKSSDDTKMAIPTVRYL